MKQPPTDQGQAFFLAVAALRVGLSQRLVHVTATGAIELFQARTSRHAIAGEHVSANQFVQRSQKHGAAADLVGERGDAEIDPSRA